MAGGAVGLLTRPGTAGVLALAVLSGLAASTQPADEDVLLLGPSIERALEAGQIHEYRVRCRAGEYLHTTVEQRGVDVVVAVVSPEGSELLTVDTPTGRQGIEPVPFVAAHDGEHRLRVRALAANPQGTYAIRLEEQRPATARDRRHFEAWRLWAEADRLSAQRTFVQALDAYERSSQLLEEVGQAGSAALALSMAGRLAAGLGQTARSAADFSRVLSLTPAGARTALRGAAFLGLGAAQPAQALEHFEQARAIFREIHDRKGEAFALNGLALAQDEQLGDSAKAIELFQEVLAIARSIDDRDSMATALHNMAALYHRRGEHREAIRTYEDALGLKRAAGDPRELAGTLDEMGTLHFESGDYHRAIDLHEEAARLAREVGNRAREVDALANIGRARLARGETDLALAALLRSLELSAGIKDDTRQAGVRSRLGEAYAAAGDLPKARESLHAALQTLRGSGVIYWPIRTLLRLGEVCLRQDQMEEAERAWGEALALARSSSAPAFEAAAHNGLARVALRRNEPARAATEAEAALDLVEARRGRIGEGGLQASYFASVRSYYETAIEASMARRLEEGPAASAAKAFALSERARARRLLDVLAESALDFSTSADPGLVAQETDLRRNLHAIAAKEAELLRVSGPAGKRATLAKQMRTLTGEHDRVLARLKETSPAYAALVQPTTLGIEQVQRDLLDPETALLEYFLGDERSYVWVATAASLTAHELPRRSTIESMARALHGALSYRAHHSPPDAVSKARLEQADREATRRASDLSRMVLPEGLDLRGIRRLVVIADGALHLVPFAALPYPATPRPRDRAAMAAAAPPLAQHLDVSYAPSASWVHSRRRLGQRASAPGKTLAILADPVFERSDGRLQGGSAGRMAGRRASSPPTADLRRDADGVIRSGAAPAELPRLFFSGEEAKAAASFAGDDALVLLGFDATRENATSPALTAYRIVHFAAHALVNDDHPELSGIVLSQLDRRGRSRDGFLGLHDIYNMKLPAETVVLSACHTAVGTALPGEGLLGLARGFMYAGSRRVVASLWPVDDAATADLMRVFYRAMLREGRPAAAALREAQMEMAKTQKWRAPYYWAGFIVQGDWP